MTYNQKVSDLNYQEAPHNKATRVGTHLWLVISIIAVVIALIFKDHLRIPVKPEAKTPAFILPVSAPVPPTVLNVPRQIPDNIDKSLKEKNERALKFFENRVGQIISDSETHLAINNKKFAFEISTFNSCVYLIYLMAYDKVKGSSESETTKYFNAQIGKSYDPIFARIDRELDLAVEKFKQDLMENGVSFATELCQYFNQNDKFNNIKFDKIQSEEDFNNALGQLGLTGAIHAVALPLDIAFVVKSEIFKRLLKNVMEIIVKIFAKPIAVAAGSAVIATADGPFPIGDVIAIGGLIWTCYDICSSRALFENEVLTSMTNFSTELSLSQKKQFHDLASNLLKSHESIQDRIRKQYLNPGI